MQNTANFWDRAAEKYARSPIEDMDSYEYSLGRTRSYLKATDTVLEVGCGTASTALKLAGDVEQIVASDISSGMLAVGERNAAAQGIKNVRLVEADAEQLPEGPFDVIMAFSLLHLVRDLDRVLADIHTRLPPGGLFISKTFCTPERGVALKYRMMRLIIPVMQLFGKAPFVRFMRIVELEEAVTRAGFEIIETGNYPAVPPRRYIVARKR